MTYFLCHHVHYVFRQAEKIGLEELYEGKVKILQEQLKQVNLLFAYS